MDKTKETVGITKEDPAICNKCGTWYDKLVGRSKKHRIVDMLVGFNPSKIKISWRKKKNGIDG